MTTPPNQSPLFRSALKGELNSWIDQGILAEEAAQRLNAIYELDQLGNESSRRLAAVIFTIGGLLVGGGVISLVAANWELLPTFIKVVLLFAALLGCHLAGYWLRYHRNSPRLGHALIFCGCLIFGANIGLLAQIFNISGTWHNAYAVWAIGSLAMAWAVRSWLIGALALALSFIWFAGFADDHHERLATVYPFLLAIFFLPLGVFTRSRALYALTFAGLISAMTYLAGNASNSGRLSLVAMAAGGFFSWTAGEYHRVTQNRPELGNAVAVLGGLAIAACAYIGSFHGLWSRDELSVSGLWLVPSTAAVLASAILGGRMWRQMNGEQRIIFTGLAMACLMVVLGMVLSSQRPAVLPIFGNLAALIIAAIGIGKGILDERRSAFWLGTLFLALLVLSRFLEYETSLLLKSLAFIVCGTITIVAGIAYEKFLRRKEVAA
ncbi:MAG: DUF2157 domain-containing protein [Blastocatellia bacterium]